MANHKSSLKRIRRDEAKRLHNKFYARSTRSAVRKIKTITDKKEAEEMLPKVTAMLDKLAKRSVIHDNKASRLKSQITRHVASL
ncbi:MAG: 30S ribosomal protein S20 [Bacteroidales bacterium]|jgi:small subunit ribosomal protein S20|nr:30S ribosomal protein S20 [Bacteroidales bacterium]